MEHFVSRDLENIVTPLNVKSFEEMLVQSGYNRGETEFLVEGFTTGFDIGYCGVTKQQSTSQNIPLTVGSKVELWKKVMK